MKFSLKRISRKGLVFGVSAGVALGLTGAAFAFFTSTGSGNGSATTGSATNWGVVASAETGTMYPGQGSASVPFTITNNGSGNQALSSVIPTVAHDSSGNVETISGSTLTPVSGCLATWYTPANGTISPAIGTSILPTGTVTDTVTVTMTDAPTSQNACQNVSPAITLTVG